MVNLTGVCGGGGTVVVEGLDLGRDIGGTWAWPCSDPKNWFLFFKFCSSPWRILPSCPGMLIIIKSATVAMMRSIFGRRGGNIFRSRDSSEIFDEKHEGH